jgi:hypothetical protein
MMDGKDMRQCASAMNPCAPVFFQDKDGNIHEVYSFKYVRNTDIGSANLLLEIGSVIADFGECHIEQPPQELIDYINKNF